MNKMNIINNIIGKKVLFFEYKTIKIPFKNYYHDRIFKISYCYFENYCYNNKLKPEEIKKYKVNNFNISEFLILFETQIKNILKEIIELIDNDKIDYIIGYDFNINILLNELIILNEDSIKKKLEKIKIIDIKYLCIKTNFIKDTKKYKIQSSKNPNVQYNVTDDNGNWECDCPSYRYTGTECKHIRQLKTK